MNKNSPSQQEWSSSLGFIIACVGSAVGLGNIWKFPYITYENGGGAFVIIYLVAILMVGLPIMIAELVLGRHGKLNVYDSFKKLSNNAAYGKALGILCLFSAFTILSFYSVVAGWTLDYFFNSISGALKTLTSETVGPRFGQFVASGPKQVLYHSLFMLFTAYIVLKGTARIEKAVKFLMPALGVMVLTIAGISIYNYGGSQSLNFLFHFNFAEITPHGVLEAVGHAFFTLSLGLAAMLVYGSYLPRHVSLVKAGLWITSMDTIVALMACMMIYPMIFGTNMEVKESSAILFTTLSLQFNAMPGGSFISAIFYLLVAFAALSSTISLLEPVVSFVSETFKIKRNKATVLSSLAIWLVGIGSALSNGAVSFFTNLNIMDRLDYLTSNWTLPIGGMCIALFCGWFIKKEDKLAELYGKERTVFYPIWNFTIRYISPLLVFIVILYKVGIIS